MGRSAPIPACGDQAGSARPPTGTSAARTGRWKSGALRLAAGWLRRYGEIVVFGIGLATAVFLIGIAVGRIGMFPWPIINAAIDAATDLRMNASHYLGIRSRYEGPTDRAEGGLTVNDPTLAFQGYTFFTGYRRERSDRYDAYLLDMDGKHRPQLGH